uniref:Uncharacterized protein n=1 Tax=Oryza sativa subsp. japonica TaxID=39947 RepID=Q6EQ79_ORYSJ|nr:hypothetical protein [Oryza sativa Japonica Group]BAD29191.1 hypothetical protein [Oryza sativa Japonica Group]
MAEDDWVTRPKVERVELEGSLRRIRSSAGNGGVAIPMFSHYEDQLRVGDGITAEVGVVAAEAELGGRGKAARRGEGAVEKKQENAAGRGFLAARQRKKTKKRGGGLGEIFLMDTEPKARRAWHEEGDNSDFLVIIGQESILVSESWNRPMGIIKSSIVGFLVDSIKEINLLKEVYPEVIEFKKNAAC